MFAFFITSGYIAPEYAMRGHLTDKADVYSFGIVALEIVSGRSNTGYMPQENFEHLIDWVTSRFIDFCIFFPILLCFCVKHAHHTHKSRQQPLMQLSDKIVSFKALEYKVFSLNIRLAASEWFQSSYSCIKSEGNLQKYPYFQTYFQKYGLVEKS